jgi:glyoxylase-like metal-dependent hydrolase (beta-lactamase superfamily II)
LVGYVYLLLGNFPPTLIDTGSGEGFSTTDILNGFEQVRTKFGEQFNPQQLERILITHAHIDHAGGASSLSAFLEAEIWIHIYDSRIVAAYEERVAVANISFQRFLTNAGIEREQRSAIIREFGFVKGRCSSTSVARLLRDGDTFDGINVHHVPGHCAGQLCFELQPFLFVGDLILQKTVAQIWPQSLASNAGLINQLASLDKIVKLTSGKQFIALPGHEDIIQNVTERIETVKRTHARRLERVEKYISQSPKPITIAELAKKMYANLPLNRNLLALADVGAYVEYLQQNAVIRVANYEDFEQLQEPIFRYARV